VTSTGRSWSSSSTRRTCCSTTPARRSSTPIARTVRLIRSKGVGVFFVTQTPKDVPAEVLAQLGNRVQHALRAFTPDDAKALKATVSTFPDSDVYDLRELLTSMGSARPR
jgi:DNA helicase HerA-like ATPase